MPGGQFSHFQDKMSLARDIGHRGSVRDDPGHSGTVGQPRSVYNIIQIVEQTSGRLMKILLIVGKIIVYGHTQQDASIVYQCLNKTWGKQVT